MSKWWTTNCFQLPSSCADQGFKVRVLNKPNQHAWSGLLVSNSLHMVPVFSVLSYIALFLMDQDGWHTPLFYQRRRLAKLTCARKNCKWVQSVQEIWALYLVLCTSGLFVSRMAFWIMSCWACPKLGVRIIEEIYLHLILQILDVIYRSFQHCHYINLLPNHEYFRRADWQTTGWTFKLVPASSDLTPKKIRNWLWLLTDQDHENIWDNF
jgi:hypothetical protein